MPQESIVILLPGMKQRRILEKARNAALEEAPSFQSTHQTVLLRVNAEPHGSCADRKRGWSEVAVEVFVKCVAPSNMGSKLVDSYSYTGFIEGDFIKNGNNGTVSCNTFCGAQNGHQIVWGNGIGYCVGARNEFLTSFPVTPII